MDERPSEGGAPAGAAGRTVRVRLFAALRERAGADTVDVVGVPDGATIADLKALLASQRPELGALSGVAGVIGTTYASDGTVVDAGDEVALLPPVSGGLPEAAAEDAELERGVFELSADPLEPGALQARVEHPSCGAVVLFTGVTRERNRGEDVVRLDYEAFAEMSGPEMRRIFDDCGALHGPGAAGDGVDRTLRMLCAHRTGTVGVGEPSVVIAVASPHRAAAFDAARFLIDTLKERLPVWKKEVYRGGHHWIGDRS